MGGLLVRLVDILNLQDGNVAIITEVTKSDLGTCLDTESLDLF